MTGPITPRQTCILPPAVLLDDFTLASEPGNDRVAAERVARSVQPLSLSARRLDNLRTAVAEAALNAIEHGNQFATDKPVGVQVFVANNALNVTVSDCGGGCERDIPVAPDLDAKLRGEQSPRGWGLFLIRNMVDACWDESEGDTHRVHLQLQLS